MDTPVGELIYAALAPLFGGQVYPDVAPDSSVPPYAVYGQVGSAPVNTLNDGIPLESDRYQIDVYATTASQCKSLQKLTRAAMLALPRPIGVYLTLELQQYEADVKWHRSISDFLISQSRSSP